MSVRVNTVHISLIIHIKMSGCLLDSAGSGQGPSTGSFVLRNAHPVCIKGGELLLLDLTAKIKLDAHCRVQILKLLM